MSSRELSQYEEEALSLGLKFSSGKDKMDLTEHVIKNYSYSDQEADKGFIQGVITCCKAIADSEQSALPKRYMVALAGLAKDNTIVISSADKGGGIIILNKSDYDLKMRDLLRDEHTYSKKKTGFIKRHSVDFNRKARSILKKSERGGQLQHLLEQDPKAPKMRVVPKVHKAGVPMRPITSGIGSAPHRLAKILAKPLSKLLGSISESHLKNSGDLLNRLNQLNFSGKKMASFDVKALFTNVPVEGAIRAIKLAISNIPTEEFPVPKPHFLKLIQLCLEFQAFTFNNEEFTQVRGLAMGAPLSPVAACLYMETLEKEHFQEIMGTETTWLRYVDDVFVLVPEVTDLNEKLRKLNEVEDKIQFTLENEEHGTLPFLDVAIIRSENTVKYRVYRKKTSQEDFIHYLSAHSDRIKSGVVIGFFLRAFRICSEQYLDAEVGHIFEAFTRLMYPKAFLLRCLRKAKKIKSKAKQTSLARDRSAQKLIVIPSNSKTSSIAKTLKKAGVKIVERTGTKISDLTRNRNKGSEGQDSIVYKVPCSECSKAYLGETYRGFKKGHRNTEGTFRITS